MTAPLCFFTVLQTQTEVKEEGPPWPTLMAVAQTQRKKPDRHDRFDFDAIAFTAESP